MVAPVPAQISNLRPRLPPAHYTAAPCHYSLPTTHFLVAPVLSDFCVALSAVFERSTPLLPITSLQPQQFQAITNSFPQRRATIHPILNGFRTLSIATGGVPPRSFPTTDFQASNASTLLFTRAWCLFALSLPSFLHSFPLFSIVCSLFSQNTRVGGINASAPIFASAVTCATRHLYPLCPRTIAHTSCHHGVYPLRASDFSVSSLKPPGIRTSATSTFSSRRGRSANIREQRP